MSCKCQTQTSADSPNTTQPDEPCIFCAEKHFSTAMRLAKEYGYVDVNRQHIIGELVLVQWHLVNLNSNMANIVRMIRHMIQNREEDKIKLSWKAVASMFNYEIMQEISKKRKEKSAAKNTAAYSELKEVKEIYIFSNVVYPEEKKLKTNGNELLVFLNKAVSADYYSDHTHRVVWHRAKEKNYGTKVNGCLNRYVFDKAEGIPREFITELKNHYDWNYEVKEGAVKCATTGYMVTKYLKKLYPDATIRLVNFGYEVKNSTYRASVHNWQFENLELQSFEHIYTAERS